MSTRRRSRRPATKRRSMSLGGGLLVLALAALLYLFDNGFFDRWLADDGVAPFATSEPAPDPESEPVPGPEAGQSDPQPGEAPRSSETATMVGFANGPVQVYFTRPGYPERAAGRVGGIDETVAADMDRAQRSVDIAVFDLDLPKVGAALIRAKQRGLQVRAVIDAENLEAPEVAALAGEMQQAGVPITFDRRSAFMHNKFVVLDDAVVWTGSWNPTINDTFRNNNNFVRIAEARLAGDYTRKFELLFAGKGGPGNPAQLANPVVEFEGYRVAAAFSPDSNVTGAVVRAIEGARSQIDVLAFSFTSDPIADALIAANARGVAVRGVMESRNASGSGSELETLQTAGVDVLEDGNCYIMHHKVFVIDNARVITGSFNWSAQAQNSNDENAVIVDNAWFAQRYTDEFQRIYDQARNPVRCGR